MKNSVLEYILFDNMSVSEKMHPNAKYCKIRDKCNKMFEDLKEVLTKEQFEKVDNLINENLGLEYESSVDYFKVGFKIALRLAAECFCE